MLIISCWFIVHASVLTFIFFFIVVSYAFCIILNFYLLALVLSGYYWNLIMYFSQSYHKALSADPSYKPAAECLAIVLTDLGTSLKLAGNTQDGIQKYYEALKIDPHYAVIWCSLLFFFFVVHCLLLEFPFFYLFYSLAYVFVLKSRSLHIITWVLSTLNWCNMTQPLVAMRRLLWRGPCMLKHTATWVSSIKIVVTWSQQLHVMRGIQLQTFL